MIKLKSLIFALGLCSGPCVCGTASVRAEAPPQLRDDPVPIGGIDACTLTPVLIPFERFDAVLSPAVDRALDRIFDRWRMVGGFIFIVGRAERVELSRTGSEELNNTRAEALRGALVRRGVPASTVWTRAGEPPSHTGSEDSPEDRLVPVYLSGAPTLCMAEIQRRRLDWVLRHCIHSERVERPDKDRCAEVLEDRTYNQGR